MTLVPGASPPSSVVVLCADEGARDALAYWLNSSGISAVIARSGYQARALLSIAGTRMLVTDRALPPWPGLDTLSALKKAIVEIKVAVLDNGVPDNAALARAAGADVILPWPLRRANVIAACQERPQAEQLPCAT